MNKNQFFIILYLVLSSFQINAQSLFHKIPFEEQINNSSLIVEGKVVERKAYISSINNHIYTINKIQVFRVFKGEELPFINVVTRGGSINFKKEEVTPSLRLRKNFVGVFLLEEDANQFNDFSSSLKNYHTYSDLQGFYKYDEYRNQVASPFISFPNIQDSFYKTITAITNTNKEITDYSFAFERQSKGLVNANITGFTPQDVRSGIGETITISGTNFGDTRGIILFKNADNGGATFEEAVGSAIKNWSDTSITVAVPSFAGTGRIQVITNNVDFMESNDDLTILSAELNSAFESIPDEDFRAKLYNSDLQGGYTWTYNESFYENTEAVEAFQRAIDSWVCQTNISWLVSDEQSPINTAEEDGINIVIFKSGSDNSFDEIDSNTLAVTITYYRGCQNGDTVTSYVDELDMIFNSDFSWYFGDDTPSANENDFQGTATHELGHAHSLGHVIAPTNLMHFETPAGEDSATRVIDDDSKIGAILNYDFSKTSGLCGQRIVVDRACMDYELLDVTENEGLVTILNPITDNLNLEINEIGSPEYSFLLYDLNGALLISDTLFNLQETVNTSSLSNGLYVVKVVIGDKVSIQKVVKQ